MTESTKERTYSSEEVEARLKGELPHWYLEGGWIRRKYRTHSWKGTLMVINAVGHLAEAAWHHRVIRMGRGAAAEPRRQGHHRQGLRAGEENRGRGPLAAGQNRRRARRHA